MNQFGRIVMGYHGCPANRPDALGFVRGLIAGTHRVEDWRPSSNEYDWLGGGVYFWEYGPKRARKWAGENGEVIGALIQLGNCFDLTDPGCEKLLRITYKKVAATYESRNATLPTNEAAGGFSRKLDRLVLDQAMDIADAAALEGNQPELAFQTVRSAFEEGEAAFPGSKLRTQTHIQIAVRKLNCILGVFRPNFQEHRIDANGANL